MPYPAFSAYHFHLHLTASISRDSKVTCTLSLPLWRARLNISNENISTSLLKLSSSPTDDLAAPGGNLQYSKSQTGPGERIARKSIKLETGNVYRKGHQSKHTGLSDTGLGVFQDGCRNLDQLVQFLYVGYMSFRQCLGLCEVYTNDSKPGRQR